ncbi:MAG TPA: GNAT family N-acyltransferase [Paenalcaligenes sp.]|nr:GNAT family N-acyltransferase [Paenalcaligenes sp.]
MLELAPSRFANLRSEALWQDDGKDGLQLRLAATAADLQAVQRLRYEIFTEELHAVFPDAEQGLDSDHFDSWCEHFMVVDRHTDQVVGTYRLLTPENAIAAGGYYSEQEFDLGPLQDIRPSLVEVGRSCIHANYRTGRVIMLLWSGIAALMRVGGYRYLLGCASVSLRDDGVTAAEVWRCAQESMANNTHMPQLQPIHHYPVEKLNSTLPARIPPLIKGYLNLGAIICGAPAWDPDFNTADFPILLDLEQLDARYRKHFNL